MIPLGSQPKGVEIYRLPEINGRRFAGIAVEHGEEPWADRYTRVPTLRAIASHRRVVFEYYTPEFADSVIAALYRSTPWGNGQRLNYGTSQCLAAGQLGPKDLWVVEPAHDYRMEVERLKLGIPGLAVGLAGTFAADRGLKEAGAMPMSRRSVGSLLALINVFVAGNGNKRQVENESDVRMARSAELITGLVNSNAIPNDDEPTLLVYPRAHLESLAAYMAKPWEATRTVDFMNACLQTDFRQFGARHYKIKSDIEHPVIDRNTCGDLDIP